MNKPAKDKEVESLKELARLKEETLKLRKERKRLQDEIKGSI